MFDLVFLNHEDAINNSLKKLKNVNDQNPNVIIRNL